MTRFTFQRALVAVAGGPRCPESHTDITKLSLKIDSKQPSVCFQEEVNGQRSHIIPARASTHTHTDRHNVLTGILQANLGKLVAPSVALTGRWGCHKVLQPVPHPLISTTMTKAYHNCDCRLRHDYDEKNDMFIFCSRRMESGARDTS